MTNAEAMRAAERAKAQAESVRLDILNHAAELFTHYGFGKTNIGDIANCCCMSPGNLYRYYRNKQAIGLAVIASFFEMNETAMETELILPGGSTEDRVTRFVVTGIGHWPARSTSIRRSSNWPSS